MTETPEKIVYATLDESGRLAIITGVLCDQRYCREFGCDFPGCAILGGEVFDTAKEARVKYPHLKIV